MNALPRKKVHNRPEYVIDKMGKVTSTARYKDYGTVEVMFIDHGKAMPVWVVGDINRHPVEGDFVVVGYMEGRKDVPYLKGFVKTDSYTANYIEVGKDFIRLQLPKNERDREESMNNTSLKDSRVYVEINLDGIAINHPDGDIWLRTPKGNVQILSKSGAQTL